MPFDRFPGVDVLLGPEMRATGEVMGIDRNFGLAFGKAEAAAGVNLPVKGTVFISVANRDKRSVIFPAKRLQDLGFHIVATKGTAQVLRRAGVEAETVSKVSDPEAASGSKTVASMLAGGDIEMVFNTPFGRSARSDGYFIRQAAIEAGVPSITTMSGIAAAVHGIEALISGQAGVRRLQEYLLDVRGGGGAPC